jgi:uncharacterized SAM-binding protein YcdF (DUF218 family)
MDAEHALRAILRTLVLLPLGPVLLAVAGLWWTRRRPRTGRAVAAAALTALVLLSVPVVASRLASMVEAYPVLPPGAPLQADAIVVLGGGVRRAQDPSASTPGPASLERLAAAAALARRTGLPLLLSGGSLESGPSEADVMQATLRASFGLEARFVEPRSRDTHENALESARILLPLGLRHVVLVTSAVHMRRAVGEFVAAGLDVIPAPVAAAGEGGRDLSDWLPRAAALETSYGALYECGGRLVAWLGVRS